MADIPEVRDLESMLKKHFDKNVRILSQKSKLLTTAGENYGSVMTALDVTIEDDDKIKQDLHLVAKFIPRNEVLREMFQVQTTFIIELRAYIKIAPLLAEIEDEYNITEDRSSDLFAKCYGGRSNLKETEGFVDEDSVLLLENLKTLGYETGDRLVGFNYETAAFILKHLAKFHAGPIAVKYLKPESYNDVILKTLNVPRQSIPIDEEKIAKYVNEIKEIVYDEKYKSQVEKMAECMTNKIIDYMAPSDPNERFATFCHSDFWVNNMMYKKENGKPSDLIIIDFQAPSFKSLVFDLLFFLYSSVSPSDLYENVDELIQIYYDSFADRLKEFNLDLKEYSWDAFMSDIRSKAPEILSHILTMYKPILLERGKIEDMNEFKEEDFLSLDGVTDYCKSVMKKTFIQFAEKRWI